LIPKSVLLAAIRALPGDAVTGHSPDIFVHARLADGKSAPASPAEGKNVITAVADQVGFAMPLSICGYFVR